MANFNSVCFQENTCSQPQPSRGKCCSSSVSRVMIGYCLLSGRTTASNKLLESQPPSYTVIGFSKFCPMPNMHKFAEEQ